MNLVVARAAAADSSAWDPSEWDALAAAATIMGAFITLFGVLITGSVLWTTKQRVAEQRLAAYNKFWSLLEPARIGPGARPFTASEREALAIKMTHWYYESGIFLTDGGRSMLLKARDHLYMPDEKLSERLRVRVQGDEGGKGADTDLGATPDKRRERLARDELSLLRTRMKADIGQYGRWYSRRKLHAWEKDFLKECRENRWRRPWRRPLRDVLASGN